MTTGAFRVEFTEAATEQAEQAAAWWRANRDAVELFDIELAYALELLTHLPPLTQAWADIDGTPVRKVRLPRTGYALFFTIDSDLVTVHAVWHGARGTGPQLP